LDELVSEFREFRDALCAFHHVADHELVVDIGLIEVERIYFKQAHIDQGDGEQFVKDVKTLISCKTGNARLLKISYEFLDQLIDKVFLPPPPSLTD
jgi:hypothetical protein